MKCPDLGPGSGHQILKVGDAEQTQEEAFFFGKIARDFSYVTRPAAQGRVTIELQGHGVIEAYGCFYPKVFPVNKPPGNLRALTEPDLLTLSAVICHLCLLYLKVADVQQKFRV